jgi:tetratricopeptide (TPR) repeat protein
MKHFSHLILLLLIAVIWSVGCLVYAETPHQWLDKGTALYDLKKYDEALVAFDMGLKTDPNDTSLWFWKGLSLGNLDKYDEALEAYDQGLKTDPKDTSLWWGRGNALQNLGRYEDATTAFDQGLKINPKDASLWNGKGTALFASGKYEKALVAYDTTLRIDPKREGVIKLRDMALNELNKIDNSADIESSGQTINKSPIDLKQTSDNKKEKPVLSPENLSLTDIFKIR